MIFFFFRSTDSITHLQLMVLVHNFGMQNGQTCPHVKWSV